MLKPHTIAAVVLTLALGAPAEAQRNRGNRDRGPALGVARIGVADGDVRVRAPSGDEIQARGGDELRPGDVVITGSRSRAEIQLDRGNYARLAGETELRILDLGNLSYRVELVRGLAALTQFERYDADLDVETRQARLRVIKPAEFAVEARGGEQTDVIVRDGQVDVATDRRTERVKGGLVSIRGQGADVSIRNAKAESRSDFEDWAKRRDKMLGDGSGRGYWPRTVVGVGVGWGRWGGWGFPYYPYYNFGPGLRTYASVRSIRRLPAGRRGFGRRR